MVILTALLPLIVSLGSRLIAYAFEKHYLNEEQKKAYLAFLDAMKSKPNTSVASKDVFDELHERLKGKV